MVRNTDLLQKLNDIQAYLQTKEDEFKSSEESKLSVETSKMNFLEKIQSSLDSIQKTLEQNQKQFIKFAKESDERADDLEDALKKFARESEDTADEFRDALRVIQMSLTDIYVKLDMNYKTIKQLVIEDELKIYNKEISKLSQAINETVVKVDILLKIHGF